MDMQDDNTRDAQSSITRDAQQAIDTVEFIADSVPGPRLAADAIAYDIVSRAGLGGEWEQVDDNTQQDIIATWQEIIRLATGYK